MAPEEQIPAYEELLQSAEPWPWYSTVFQRGYELPAAELARNRLRDLRQAKLVDQAADDVTALESALLDSTVSWPELQEMVNSHDKTVFSEFVAERYVVVQEQVRLKNQEWLNALSELDQLIESGDIQAALNKSQEIENTLKRGGQYSDNLIYPVALSIIDEQGRTVPRLRVSVNDVQVTSDPENVYLKNEGASIIQITAEGYISQSVTIDQRIEAHAPIRVEMKRADVWRRPPLGGAWHQQFPLGSELAIQVSDKKIQILHAVSGEVVHTVESSAIPGSGNWVKNPEIEQSQCTVGTTGGRFVRLAVRPDSVANSESAENTKDKAPVIDESIVSVSLPGEKVVAMDTGALTYQDGDVHSVLFEAVQGRNLQTFVDGQPSWLKKQLASVLPATVMHTPGRIGVFADEALYLYEESGIERGRVLFKDKRIGRVLRMSHSTAIVPQLAGLEIVEMSEDAVQPSFVEVSGGLIQTSELVDSVVITLDAGGTLKSIDISNGGSVGWSVPLDITGTLYAPSVANGFVCVASEDGQVVILNSQNGEEIQRFQHPTRLQSRPIISGSRVIVAGVEETVGYHAQR